ncbi:MAG: ABC transporter ATP-binding protein, partial [Clostridium sp.]
MITINNVTKKYGKTTVLQDVNYSFRDTGVTCVIGASGSGKTTLLNLLSGFDTDYSGSITVCGVKITELSAKNLCEYRRNHIGFVFQNYNLITGYTVLENIMIAARLNGKSDDMNTKEAYILIEKLGIKEKINEPIQNLSGGQKQRVAIARVLINDPQIIFADEPTGALDRNTSNQIMEILKEVAKDKLVVIITHDNKICDWADDVISIVNGSINIVSHKPSINKVENKNSICSRSGNVYILKPGIKNFKVHFI